MYKFLTIILLLVFLTGCKTDNPSTHAEKVDQLYQADPKLDAAEAISQQDFRFIAVHNHDLIMPMNIEQCLVDKFGYRVLSNESLQYMSYDFQMYGAMSGIYANWYNYEILSKLEELEEYPCK